ncbi:MAG: glycosyltransferase family 9 protein [Ignavibacteriales bacterium]|nr:glycosyltransferase family 9 protein [Ignavibacteriales bacterium]
MEFLKPVEIGFRRLLLLVLGVFVRRGKILPASLDFATKKYLFVRQDRIGDVLVSTPLIHALKSKYPHSTIDFLLSSNNHFVLSNEPLVRKRWVYRKTLAGAIEILRLIRRERYNFVIDLMDNPSATSTVLCMLAGGEWNVGLSKNNAYAYDVVVPLLSRRDYHIIDRLAALLTAFGLERETLDLKVHYSVLEESKEFASQFLSAKSIQGKQTVAINISPGEGTRFWGTDHYQSLIRWLRTEQREHPIVVLFQPSDKAVAEAIVQPFPDVVLSAETKTFDQFAALVQRMWLLITPDTSAVHLAAAFSIPSVVLYVQSDRDLRIWEPYGSLSETLVTDVDDLRTIPVEHVVAACGRLMQNLVPPSRSSIPSGYS